MATSKMVDSRYHNLDVFSIVNIAVKQMPRPEGMDDKTLVATILSEVTMPECKANKFGNTLFIMHTKGRVCSFRAFNADIAPNFVNNSKNFCKWAYNDEGIDYGITEFEDEAISKLFSAIARNPPMPSMGFKQELLSDDTYRCTLKFGKERG